MYCSNCGNKLDENATECSKCGHKVINADDGISKNEGSDSFYNKLRKYWNIIVDKILKYKKVSAIIAATVVLLVVFVMQPKKINLEDMVTIEFSGYDTVGKAYVDWNTVKLEMALYDAIDIDKFKSAEPYSYDNIDDLMRLFTNLQIYDSITLKPDHVRKLTNGDKITVAIDYDNKLLKDYNIKFTGKSVTFIVEGLKPLTEINPFDDLKISFTGVSPKGNLEMEYYGNTSFNTSSFKLDKYENYKNGDIVTVTLKNDPIKELENGYKVTETSQTYLVEGLDEYVDSYTELTDGFLEYIKESLDTIISYAAKEYEDSTNLGNLEYAGYVFNTAKESEINLDTYNKLYIIYKALLTSSEEDFHDIIIYYPVSFRNIVYSSEGTFGADGIYCEYSGIIAGESKLDDINWEKTKGYNNPITAYRELVTSQKEYYNYYIGGGFEVYDKVLPINKISDISEEYFNQLSVTAKDKIDNYIGRNYNTYFKTYNASNPVFEGAYLLLSKTPGNNYSLNNKLYIIYSSTVSQKRDGSISTTVYFPVEFDGLIKLPDATYMYTKYEGINGDEKYDKVSRVRTHGYFDREMMYKEIITAQRGSYNYEINGNLALPYKVEGLEIQEN